jgi:hypothetical protein
MYVWPVLLLGGVPLNPDKALPAVHRPSITIKVSMAGNVFSVLRPYGFHPFRGHVEQQQFCG